MAQYNYILVVGEKEIGTGQVSIDLRLNSIMLKPIFVHFCLLHNIQYILYRSFLYRVLPPISDVLACIQVAVRVRDKNDAPLMSIDDLLNQFKDDVASFR